MSNEKTQKLGEILLQSGIIDKLQLNTALKYQREWDRKLGEALVELGFISEPVLAKVLSKFLQVPNVELSQVKIHPLALQKVPRRLAEKYGLIPLDIQGDGPRAVIMVAMIDPTNLVAIDEVAFTSGCKVKPVVATHSDIDKSIRRHYGDDRVVDVFFDSSATTAPQQASDPRQSSLQQAQAVEQKVDEMVIMRGGVETTLQMPTKQPETPRASTISQVDSDTLCQALLRILIRKKVFDLQEIQQELNNLSSQK